MPAHWLKGFILITAIVFAMGCKNVQTRVYTEERPRVDMDRDGNFGYLFGPPQPKEKSDYKETRKFYVFEFTRKDFFDERGTVIPQKRRAQPKEEEQAPPSPQQNFTFGDNAQPSQPIIAVSESAKKRDVKYTIKKDDTLQKISQKFYNTHRRWYKIYQNNKDVIPDPNRIKPGTVIVIPMED